VKCAECRQPIAPRDQKLAVIVRDEQGRIEAVYHKHHARRARALARTGGAVPGLVYRPDSPSAYDVRRETSEDEPTTDAEREAQEQALREHQANLEEARAEDDAPDRWDDWRDPVTKTLDEIVDETDGGGSA
jgi:hypothetical protein